MKSSKIGPTRFVPEVELSTIPALISLQGGMITKICKCGMPSNKALNVGARRMFEKGIKIIGGWKTPPTMVQHAELQTMWQGLPRNQRHIYYAQFLDRQNRAFALQNPNAKQVSSLEFNTQALEVMLNDLDQNSENVIPKCRCILAMKFTEPLTNYYIEANQPNPLRSLLHNSASTNCKPEVQMLEPKMAAQKAFRIQLLGKASSAFTSIPKLTLPAGKATIVQSPQLLEKYQEFIGSTARSVEETETFLEKLLNCAVKVLPSPKNGNSTMAKNPKILIKNVRSLSQAPKPAVVKSKVKPILPKPKPTKIRAKKEKAAGQDQAPHPDPDPDPDVQPVPASWAWTLSPNSDIPEGRREEIAYLALSMVQVVYEMETTEVKTKRVPVPRKKKPKTK